MIPRGVFFWAALVQDGLISDITLLVYTLLLFSMANPNPASAWTLGIFQ